MNWSNYPGWKHFLYSFQKPICALKMCLVNLQSGSKALSSIQRPPSVLQAVLNSFIATGTWPGWRKEKSKCLLEESTGQSCRAGSSSAGLSAHLYSTPRPVLLRLGRRALHAHARQPCPGRHQVPGKGRYCSNHFLNPKGMHNNAPPTSCTILEDSYLGWTGSGASTKDSASVHP